MTKKKKDIFKKDSISISSSTEEYEATILDETEDRVKDLLNIKPIRKPKKNKELDN